MTDPAQAFEPHRAYLVAIAYRMLGSVAEAEDVVQDSFVRWLGAERDAVVEPRAFLARTVTRLCLDRLKSARAQRETYVGTWLPEPIVEETARPDTASALANDLSLALLAMLERLSPLERAAFLMHDVFEMEFSDVAEVLERSEAAVRQLAARAREHVKQPKPRFRASDDEAERLASAFGAALTAGDTDAFARLLAEDAVLYSDGGGKKQAALNPIYGRDRIQRFFAGVLAKSGLPNGTISKAWINGLPGFVLRGADGVETLAVEVADGAITGIFLVRNPDKLRHLA